MLGGTPATVEELVARYDRLVSWAVARVKTPAIADDEFEDLRQEIYLRVIEQDFLPRARAYYTTHAGRFSSSLTVLARNVTISRLRRCRRDPVRWGVELPEPTSARSVLEAEAAMVIDRLLDTLPCVRRSPFLRQAIMLFREGHSWREVSDRLDLPSSTVRNAVSTFYREARGAADVAPVAV